MGPYERLCRILAVPAPLPGVLAEEEDIARELARRTVDERQVAGLIAVLEGVKDFMVTLVLARTNPGAISVARNALRRV